MPWQSLLKPLKLEFIAAISLCLIMTCLGSTMLLTTITLLYLQSEINGSKIQLCSAAGPLRFKSLKLQSTSTDAVRGFGADLRFILSLFSLSGLEYYILLLTINLFKWTRKSNLDQSKSLVGGK